MRALRVLAVAVAVMLAGCGDDGPPKVAATVSGVDIASERVERLTSQWVKAQTAQALQKGAPAGELDRKDSAKLVLGFVIRSVYLEQVAAEMGVQDNPSGLEELAGEQVPVAEYESAGWSRADLEQSLRDARLSKAIGEKVFPKVAVSDVEVRQKYERSKSFFDQTWQTQARVAYFEVPEPAKALKERRLTGEAFDAAARELGAKQAGSLGLVTPLTPLPQPVLDAVAALAAGQTSDPVAGGGGYLVVVADSREDRAPTTFEEAKPALIKVLEDEQRQKLFFDWFNKRLAEASIKVASHYGTWDAEHQLVS
ncbi:MAG TPA: peptidyl-prolyl cis-trans isomerase [Acidimicrobiia bacterium]|nr:peptidyl-prolyl cis-trans isomerase [Acidimicrobiia bacterium]